MFRGFSRAKGTLPFDEVVEMLIDKQPFLVFTSAHLFEVGVEVGFLLGLILSESAYKWKVE